MHLAPLPVGDPRVRIAQFNVENLFDPDDDPLRRDANDVGQETYDARLAKVALTLRDVVGGADIVALQEVENQRVLDDLVARPELAALGYRGVLVEGNDQRGIDTALLYRADRVTLRAVEAPSPAAPEGTTNGGGMLDPTRLFSRPPLVATFELRGPVDAARGARELTVVANHFKSKVGETPGKANRRDHQAVAVAGIVDALRAADPRSHVVVVGDLNANTKDRAIQLLTKVAGAPDRLVDAPSNLPAEERYTGWHGDDRTMLDHLFASPGLAAGLEDVAIPHVNSDGLGDPLDPATPDGASDHDPIVATFRVD